MPVNYKRIFLFSVTLLTFIAIFSAHSPAAKAQAPLGSISGTVKDSQGASVGGAEVALVHGNVTLRTTVSGGDGKFSFDGVAAGTYGIKIRHSGFGEFSTVIHLAADERQDLNVELDVNPLNEKVVVTAEAGQVADARMLAQSINVINENEVLLRAPEVVAQVFDEEQGLNLQRTSPSLSAVFVRGLTGRNVAVYVDGVRYTTSAQRGGVGTFFSLIEPSSLGTVEVLRGPNSSQYGSDAHGGVVNFVSHAPRYGDFDTRWHGTTNTFYSSPANGFGGNQLLTYGQKNWGLLMNLNARRINRLRPAGGLDSHAAATRFLGIPSDVLGTRLPDTAFTQYGGLFRASFDIDPTTQILFSYDRNQQDGGRRYDQLAGGDGNLIADLRNIISDQFYARVNTQRFGWFDSASVTFSYNGQREERINQGGNGNPVGTITNQRERTTVLGFNIYADKQLGERNTFLLGADLYGDRIAAPAFTFDPVPRTVVNSRPRIPNGARYLTYGFFAQDIFTAIPERLRFSAALRYNVASYRASSSDAPVVAGRSLFPSDSERFAAFSGRVGAVVNLGRGFDLAAKYARGFRAPNTTDLGIVGFVGTGFEVNSQTAAALGGFIGTTAGGDAVSTGIPVT